MGQFFKTARANFVDDKMFELPVDLMFKAINQTDANITDNLDKIDAFGELLKTENLKTDDPAVNERLGYFKDKMAKMTSGIYKNPLNYRDYTGQISSTSRELDTELDNGLLGRAQEQYTEFNKRIEEINKLEDVSADKKDLLKRAVMKKYEDQGGLDFKDPNTYKQIGSLIDTPLKDVDTDELINEVAKNFTADTTASASAGPDRGYLWESKGNVEERKVKEVEDYMKNTLVENGWEAQQRQQYEWQKTLGELPRDANGNQITVDELVQRDKDDIIEAAKTKLGYRKEELSKDVSADSTWQFEQRSAKEDAEAGTGEVLHDKIDPRSAYYNEDEVKDIKKNEKNIAKVLTSTNSSSLDDLISKVYDKQGDKINFKELDNILKGSDMTREDFVNYVNYNNATEDLKTPAKLGYDKTNTEDRVEQDANLKALVNSWNTMNPNEAVKEVRIAYSDGSYHKLEHTTLGSVIEDDRGFMYIPATGENSEQVISKSPGQNGVLLDSEGEVIIHNGKSFKTEQEAIAAGAGNRVAYDTKKVASFDTDAPLFEASTGNFRERTYKNYDTKGKVDEGKDYVVTKSYYKIDPRGGRTIVNLQTIVPSNRLDK
jgi:hypothetical protein